MSDMPDPLLSVCCTTYQHVHFIRQAIEGFLMQRTSFPIEIIIRDDASTDGTASIVKEYAERHPNLVRAILHQENQFIKGLRPMPDAMAHARGKYIAVCEGDDYWTDPLKLQKQVDALESATSVSMVFHNVWVRHEESKWDRFLNHGIKKNRFTLGDVVSAEWFMGTCSMVFRQSALEGVDLSAFRWCLSGDMVLQFHLAQNGDIVYMDEVMGVYRRHEGGMSHAYWSSAAQKEAHERHQFEVFRPNHVWMQLAFHQQVHEADMHKVIEQRIAVLMRMIVGYLLRKQPGAIPDVLEVRRQLIDLLERGRPAGAQFDIAVFQRAVVERSLHVVQSQCMHHVNDLVERLTLMGRAMLLRRLVKQLWHGQYSRRSVINWIWRSLVRR